MPATDDTQEYEEDDDSHTIVEQRFAGDLGLQALGCIGAFEYPQYCNGVRGGNERTKQKTVDNREVQSQPPRQQPGEKRHDEG